MSNVIDNRVVEMRFDNQQFEKNVQQSMGTLDKLKQALNFSDVGDVGSKLNLGSIGNAIGAAGEKFSAFEAIAVGALMKIGSQAVELGEKLVKSLSIDQISAGWNKYGEMTSNVATIMATTGDDIDTVSAQMEKLLYFTDETSYNFTDMANNIGKFTANGIELNSATSAMEGIATWAAKSGQNAGTASRVMYNLAQAIGMGALKLQDWKSVELANMGTKEFKETAIEAGLAAGTLTKGIDGIAKTAKGTKVEVGTFRETLAEGWLDTNTLMATLNEYGKAAELISDIHDSTGLWASDMMDLVEKQKAGNLTTKDFADALGITTEELEANSTLSKSLADSIKTLASEEYAFSLAAYQAGQEARTFRDAIDATKDAVSSGWMKTFELIFGQYDKAKGLWTDVAEGLYDIFNSGSAARNELLKDWGTSNWDKLKNKISGAGVSMDDFKEKVKNGLKEFYQAGEIDKIIEKYGSLDEAIEQGAFSAEDLAKAVNGSISSIISGSNSLESVKQKLETVKKAVKDVWSGALSNGEDRKKAIEELGLEYETVQKLVNKGADYEVKLEDLTEEELKAIGLSEEQIKQLELIRDDYDSLINLSGKGGSDVLAEGIVNSLTAIADLLTLVRERWAEAFGKITADQLTKISDGFKAFSERIQIFEDDGETLTATGEKVKSVLDKVFAAVQNVSKIFQNVGRIIGDFAKSLAPAVEAAKGLASALYDLFMSVTGRLGDYLETVDLTEQFGNVSTIAAGAINVLTGAVDHIRVAFENWKPGNALKGLGEIFKNVTGKVAEFFKTTEDGVTPLQKIVNAFNGLGEKLKGLKGILEPVKNFFKDFWDGLKNALDLNGVTNVFDGIAKVFSNIVETLKKLLSNFTLGDALKAAAGYIGVQLLRLAKVVPDIGKGITWVTDQLYSAAKNLKGVLANFKKGGLLGGALGNKGILGNLMGNFGASNLAPVVANIKAVGQAILMLGGGILVLAAALAILAAIKPENLTRALQTMVLALAGVGTVLLGFAAAIETFHIKTTTLVATAASIALLAAALILLAGALGAFSLVAQMKTVGEGLAFMAASLVLVMAVLGGLAKQKLAVQMVAVAAAIAVVSASLLVLAAALAAFSLVAMMGTWEEGLLSMVATLGTVAVALKLLSDSSDPVKLIASAAAIAVVSASLLIMAAALAAFMLIANQGAAAVTGLIAMIATLAVVAVALTVLADVGPAILLGAAALTAGSIAIVALSVGLAAAAVAVATLATAVALGIAGIGVAVGVAVGAIAAGISVAVISVAAAVTAVVAAVAASLAMLAAAIGSAVSSIVGGLASAAASIGTAFGVIISAITTGIGTAISAIGTGLGTAIGSIGTGLGTAINAIHTGIGGAITALGTGIGNSITAVGTGIGTGLANIGKGISDGISAISASIGSFGASIASIGTGIESFGSSVKTLSFIDMVSIGKGLIELAKGIKELNKNQINVNPAGVQAYVQALQNFAQVATVVSTSAMALGTTFGTLGTQITTNLAAGIQNGVSQITAAANTIIDNLKNAFNSAANEATKSGTIVGSNFARGVSSGVSAVSAAGRQLAQTVVQSLRSAQSQFQQIGYQFSNGLAQGVRSGSGIVSSAVQSVVNQAVSAARRAAQVRSPSRVFAEIGNYMSLGMAKGIDKGASAVANSTESMVNNAIDGVSNAMSRIVDAINSDVDTDPVITPVLDLSNVQENSKKLDGLLGRNSYAYDTAGGIVTNTAIAQEAANAPVGVMAAIDPASLAALAGNGGTAGTKVDVTFSGSLAQLAAVLQPAITVETNRIGKSLINA